MAPGGGAGERQAAPSGGQPLNLGSRSLFKKQMILRNVIKEDCLKGDEGCAGGMFTVGNLTSAYLPLQKYTWEPYHKVTPEVAGAGILEFDLK